MAFPPLNELSIESVSLIATARCMSALSSHRASAFGAPLFLLKDAEVVQLNIVKVIPGLCKLLSKSGTVVPNLYFES